MMIWKTCLCETCNKERQFKYSTTLKKIYNYKPKCKQCTLTERNKLQNFSPRKHPIIDYFETIDTQEKAYIFGFLWADGCLMNAPRKNIASIKSLVISMYPKDKEILDFIVSYFGGSYKIYTTFNKQTKKISKTAHWNLNSKEVYDNFINLKFRIDSSAVSAYLFNHFLRGIIDGDGCFYIRKNRSPEIKITSNINQNWNFIANRIEFPFSIHNKTYKEGSRSNFIILGDKVAFLQYLYKDALFFLKRKHHIIKHLL